MSPRERETSDDSGLDHTQTGLFQGREISRSPSACGWGDDAWMFLFFFFLREPIFQAQCGVYMMHLCVYLWGSSARRWVARRSSSPCPPHQTERTWLTPRSHTHCSSVDTRGRINVCHRAKSLDLRFFFFLFEEAVSTLLRRRSLTWPLGGDTVPLGRGGGGRA